MTGYDVMVIDPPWAKRKGGRRNVRPSQTRHMAYATMQTSDIFALLDRDVFSLAAHSHQVWLWNIDECLDEADMEMKVRGYRRHARIVWDKENGVAPAFTVRYSHEYLVWYYKPRLAPIATAMRGKFATVWREASREHSRKPNLAYERIALLYPAARKLDVFSREKREGWDQWGDQLDHFTA